MLRQNPILVMVLVGVYLIINIIHSYTSHIDSYKASTKVKGVVVDLFKGEQMTTRGYPRGYYYPQVSFDYNDSTYYMADHAYSGYGIGDVVTVIFVDDPKEARIYTFLKYWTDTPVFIVTGFVMVFVGFFISLFIKNKRVE